jgi:hypothetical protein
MPVLFPLDSWGKYRIHNFQKKALRNMFGTEKDEIIGHLMTLLKEKLLFLHRIFLG